MTTHKLIVPALAAICCTATAAVADDAKTCAQNALDALETLNTALDKITDKGSISANLSAVEKAAAAYGEATQKMMSATPPATPEAAQEFTALQSRSQEVLQKFQANMMRLQQGGLLTPELSAAFAKMAPPSMPK